MVDDLPKPGLLVIEEVDNSANRRGEKRENSEYLPEDKDVFHRQAIQGFINDVSSVSEDVDEATVYENIKTIWKEQGFIHPKELEKQLFKQVLKETDPDKKAEKEALIDALIEESYPKDEMTGAESKSSVPLGSALANLYAIETGEPVVFVEGDYGNMGGSNDFFRELVRQIDPELAKDPSAGFKYTDALAKVTAGIANEELLKAAEDYGGTVIPFRTGGDEVRYAVIGLDKKATEKIIEERIKPKIEEFIATVDSADHTHIKYRDDKNKNGFGLSFGVAQVGIDATPVHQKIQGAEHDIDTNKVISGANRQGEVSGVERDKIRKDKLTYSVASKGVNISHVLSGHLAGVKAAHAAKEKLKQECREQGGALKVLDDIMAGNHPKYSKYFKESDEKKSEIQIDDENHALFESHTDSVKRQIKSQVPADDVDTAVLDVVSDRFIPEDPPTEFKTPRDFKKDVKYVMGDTDFLRNQGKEIENPYLYEIRFGSLGPINDNLGHQQADEILRYQAQEILKETLEKHGMFSTTKSATHKGGATYPLVVPGAKTDDKGLVSDDANELRPVKMGDLKAVLAEVKQRCDEELNGTTPGEFFEKVSDKGEYKRNYEIKDEFKDKPLSEFYNPKKDVYGITVSMAAVELQEGADVDKAMTELLIQGDAAEKAAVAEAQQERANKSALSQKVFETALMGR